MNMHTHVGHVHAVEVPRSACPLCAYPSGNRLCHARRQPKNAHTVRSKFCVKTNNDMPTAAVD
jgi:hypothetical protein